MKKPESSKITSVSQCKNYHSVKILRCIYNRIKCVKNYVFWWPMRKIKCFSTSTPVLLMTQLNWVWKVSGNISMWAGLGCTCWVVGLRLTLGPLGSHKGSRGLSCEFWWWTNRHFFHYLWLFKWTSNFCFLSVKSIK